MAEEKITPESILSSDYDSSKIVKNNVNLTNLSLDKSFVGENPIAFTLHNIFSPEECQGLIALAEKESFAKVSVDYGGSEVVNENVRSGSRLLVDDEEFMRKLWTRISCFIPAKVKGAQVVGLNERLRFLKYVPGQFFAPHTDGSYARPENKLEVSLLTIQMYLNGDFDGGETTFLSPIRSTPREMVGVKPETGMALVFQQDLTHEGSLVKSGVKYTVRTDVMYRYGVS